MSIVVLYLARGIDGGIASVNAFLESYRKHPAGVAHNLYIVAKGWETVLGYDVLRDRAAEIGARIIDLPDDGFDWGAYMRAARLVSDEWICCLNTHSRILADGWLVALANAAQTPNVGCAGCTGSWGTIAPVFSFTLPISRDIMHNRGLVKGCIALVGALALYPYRWVRRVAYFSGFPNPHLRSNAFLIRRNDFLTFTKNVKIPASKQDAWCLESGRKSLTRYILNKGQSVAVVGADGHVFLPDQWIEAATFRVPGQRNLLVADNQTNNYASAPRNLRRLMELSAWGKFFSP